VSRTYNEGDFVSPLLWDQVLYEALMEGLGFSKNRRAFRMLARTIPLASLRRVGLRNTGDLIAVLLGAAHLIPAPHELEDPIAQAYAGELRSRWRSLAHAFPTVPLHESDWLFFRLRPANFPTARIAAFAHALPVMYGPGFRGCLDILRSCASAARTLRMLQGALIVRAGGFWRYRTGFAGSSPGSGSAIGRMRATELIINAILPLALRFSEIFGDGGLRESVHGVITCGSPPPGHRALSQMRADLFRGRLDVDTPRLYQGAIELYTEYCAGLRCRECQVGVACGFARAATATGQPEICC
jgi:hypothetical protein